MFFKKLLFLILLTIFMTSCPIKKQRPLAEIVSFQLPALPESIIQVPIEISSTYLSEKIKKELPQPLLKGKTEELSIRLLAGEAKGDKSFWDYVKDPIVKIIDKAIPVSAQVLYEFNIKNLKIVFKGDQIYVEILLLTQTDLKLKSGLLPFDDLVELERKLKCPSEAKIELYGQMKMTKEATIKIELEEEKTLFQFTRLCSNQTIKKINFPEIIKSILAPIQNKIRKKISLEITSQTQKSLEDNSASLSFEKQIQSTVSYLSSPYLLQDGVWLTPHIKEVFISPFEGKGAGINNKLYFSLGINAKPTLVFEDEKPRVLLPQKMPFSIKKTKEEANIHIHGKLALAYAAKEFQSFLQNYTQQYHAEKGYVIGEVVLYPHHERVVIEIEVLKKINAKKKVMVYLSGIPKYNTEKQFIYLDELKFTTQTKDILLNFAKWFLQPKIMKKLRENAHFSVSENLKSAQKRLKNFSIEEDLGTLSGNFDYLDVGQVFVSKSDFEFFIQAKGKLRFDWKPD